MKEGNVLFNDPLKAFLFTGIWRYMVKDHSCNKRGFSLVAYLFHFFINSKGSFIFMISHAGWYIQRPWYAQSCLCDGAYIRTLTANLKE